MEHQIFSMIVDLMNVAENVINLTGNEKKKYVMDEFKKLIDNQTYERYEPFIEIMINGIIDISKKNIILDFNKRKCFKLNCIS